MQAANHYLQAMAAGQALFRKGLIAQAATAFEQAVRLKRKSFDGWYNLGVCLSLMERTDVALAAYDQALRIDRQNAPCHLQRGRTLAAMGRIESARTAFERALKLQRSPDALSDLANTLRVSGDAEAALALYAEAQRMAPETTLFRVNYATGLVEARQYDEALGLLKTLSGLTLPEREAREVATVYQTLQEYVRLDPAIQRAISSDDCTELNDLLQKTPITHLKPDTTVMSRIAHYVQAASRINNARALTMDGDLPGDWAKIEACFMIPVVDTPGDYLKLEALETRICQNDTRWQETLQMIGTINRMQSGYTRLANPVAGEAELRVWHGIACHGLPTCLPGHFKLTRNMAGERVILRASPDRVVGSIRQLLGPVRADLKPGLPRALILLLGILDLHPFADGNARVAMAVMNRELIAAGLMPALFSRAAGVQGDLGRALFAARTTLGNLDEVIRVVQEGQARAQTFVRALKQLRG